MASRFLTDEQRAAKNAHDRERRARLRAMGINPRNVGEGLIIDETSAERKERRRVAMSCATPFRDANAHVRGGSFKHDAVDHEEFSHVATDSITGDRTSYRGTGFYAGRRTNNG